MRKILWTLGSPCSYKSDVLFTHSANLLSQLLQRIPECNEEHRLIIFCLSISILIILGNFVFLSILALNAQHHVLQDINERFCLLGNGLIICTGVSWRLILDHPVGLIHFRLVLHLLCVRYYYFLHLQQRQKGLIGRALIQIKLGCIILRLKRCN